jgi:hypothetical protein
MPQPELLKQRKIVRNQQPQNENRNTRNTRINVQDKYSQIEFSTSAKKQIALQYARLKRDTSRYRERMQTKFEYSAGGTNNTAKIPHQMSLFIKQHQK